MCVKNCLLNKEFIIIPYASVNKHMTHTLHISKFKWTRERKKWDKRIQKISKNDLKYSVYKQMLTVIDVKTKNFFLNTSNYKKNSYNGNFRLVLFSISWRLPIKKPRTCERREKSWFYGWLMNNWETSIEIVNWWHFTSWKVFNSSRIHRCRSSFYDLTNFPFTQISQPLVTRLFWGVELIN